MTAPRCKKCCLLEKAPETYFSKKYQIKYLKKSCILAKIMWEKIRPFVFTIIIDQAYYRTNKDYKTTINSNIRPSFLQSRSLTHSLSHERCRLLPLARTGYVSSIYALTHKLLIFTFHIYTIHKRFGVCSAGYLHIYEE